MATWVEDQHLKAMQKELADAKMELYRAKQKLSLSQAARRAAVSTPEVKQLFEVKKELAAAKKELAASKEELSSTKKELNSNQTEVSELQTLMQHVAVEQQDQPFRVAMDVSSDVVVVADKDNRRIEVFRLCDGSCMRSLDTEKMLNLVPDS